MLKIADMTLYDVQDLAELLSLHEKTVRTLLRNDTLKGKKLAKKWYVNANDLKAYFQGEQEQA